MLSVKLYDIMLGTGNESTNELFFRGKARYSSQYKTLRIACGDTVSFSTFFNLYPYYEYFHYCGIDKPVLHLDIIGVYTVNVFQMHSDGTSRQIASELKQNKSILTVPIPDTRMGGYLYFTVTAASACILRGGSWQTEKEPERPVKLGIVICTYKREKFIKDNMAMLREAIEKNPVWADRIHVFIVDNGETLDMEPSGLYTVYPNRNLGGSGGFARGMYELSKDESFTHMLIMDDDIQFSFGTVERMYSLLSGLTEEHKDAAIGGAMLKFSHPYMQHEFGAVFSGLAPKSINRDLDLRLEDSLLKNQNAEKPEYNAWWCCCMPAHFVRDYGLPMPFFIKSDDVEYGLRTYKELILMNGIAVWHQDFDNKYSRVLEYYSRRNFMITAIMHNKCNRFVAAARYAYAMFKGLVVKNYMSVELIYRSFLDFKKGPAFLVQTDAVVLNRLISDKAPVFESKETLERRYGIEDLHYVRKPHEQKEFKVKRRKVFMLLEAYFPSFMMSDDIAVTDAGNPAATDCFRKKRIIHYDPVNQTGYVCTFDKKARRKYRRASVRTILQLLFFYGRYKKMYSDCGKIFSIEQWEKAFFLPDGPEPENKKAMKAAEQDKKPRKNESKRSKK